MAAAGGDHRPPRRPACVNQGTATLRVEATDRWRIAVATLATIAALPVLVRVDGQQERAAPPSPRSPVAPTSADALRGGSTSDAPAPRPTIGPQRSNLPRATQPSQPPVLEIAVPASDPATTAKGLGSYRQFAGARPRQHPVRHPRRAGGHPGEGREPRQRPRGHLHRGEQPPAAERLLITVDTDELHQAGRPGAVADPRPPHLVTLTRRRAVELLERHGLAPRRALGQNFVVDPNTVRRIARLAGVGPGRPGGGDRRRARVAHAGAGRDRRGGHRRRGRPRPGAGAARGGRAARRAGGRRRRPPPRLDARSSTATTLGAGRQPALQRGHAARRRPARRRPGHRPHARDGAAGGRRAAGRRAGRRRLRRGEREGRVLGHGRGRRARCPPTVFLPRPKVESALVAIRRDGRRRRSRPTSRAARLFALVRAGFGQRRKMLRRSLAGLVSTRGSSRQAGIRPEARAEELAVAGLGALARAVEQAG